VLVVSGCSDSGDARFGEPVENIRLTGCADTDSCFSNPPLQIGENRPAVVRIPSDYTTTTRYPLIVLLHGLGADGAIQAAYLGLNPRVDTQQYILVAPDGTVNAQGNRFWNATSACCADEEEQNQVDDVAYIRSLIEEAAATYSIDSGRIGLYGHSNGGFLALRMACEASDLVTSVVSLAGSTFADMAMCAPATYPVSVLTLHGDLDAIIFYDGRQNGLASYPGALETISRFAGYAQCDTDNPTMALNLDVIGNVDGKETTVLAYSDCAEGTDVTLWTIVGGPHTPFPWVESAIDSTVDWLIEHRRD